MDTNIKGWFLPREKVEHMLASLEDTLNQCNQAHYTNLDIRINGKNEYAEGDWIKHLVPVTKDPRT